MDREGEDSRQFLSVELVAQVAWLRLNGLLQVHSVERSRSQSVQVVREEPRLPQDQLWQMVQMDHLAEIQPLAQSSLRQAVHMGLVEQIAPLQL